MATGKTILLVDDNPSVLLLMERALTRDGYTVLTAETGEAALRMLTGDGSRIDLLVADLVLPRISGLELARRVTESDPSLRIILVSGYAGQEAAISAPSTARVQFLGKPFSATSFRTMVRELLEGPQLGKAADLDRRAVDGRA